MKKFSLFLVILTFLFTVILTSCNGVAINNDETAPTKDDVREPENNYKVTYVVDGHVELVDQFTKAKGYTLPELKFHSQDISLYYYVFTDGSRIYVDEYNLEDILKANVEVTFYAETAMFNNATVVDVKINNHLAKVTYMNADGELYVNVEYDGENAGFGMTPEYYYVFSNGNITRFSDEALPLRDLLSPVVSALSNLLPHVEETEEPIDLGEDDPIDLGEDDPVDLGENDPIDLDDDDPFDFDDDEPDVNPSFIQKLLMNFLASEAGQKVVAALSQLMATSFMTDLQTAFAENVEIVSETENSMSTTVTTNSAKLASLLSSVKEALGKEDVKSIIANLVYGLINPELEVNSEQVEALNKLISDGLQHVVDYLNGKEFDVFGSLVMDFSGSHAVLNIGNFNLEVNSSRTYIDFEEFNEVAYDLDEQINAAKEMAKEQLDAYLELTPAEIITLLLNKVDSQYAAIFQLAQGLSVDDIKEILVNLLDSDQVTQYREALETIVEMSDEELENLIFDTIKYDEVKAVVEEYLALSDVELVDKFLEAIHYEELAEKVKELYLTYSPELSAKLAELVHLDELQTIVEVFLSTPEEDLKQMLFEALHYDEVKTIVSGVIDLSKDELFALIDSLLPEGDIKNLVNVAKELLTDEVVAQLNEKLHLEEVKAVVKSVLALSNDELFEVLKNVVYYDQVKVVLQKFVELDSDALLDDFVEYAHQLIGFNPLNADELPKQAIYDLANQYLHLDEVKEAISQVLAMPKDDLYAAFKEAVNLDQILTMAKNFLSLSNKELADLIFNEIHFEQYWVAFQQFLNTSLNEFITVELPF